MYIKINYSKICLINIYLRFFFLFYKISKHFRDMIGICYRIFKILKIYLKTYSKEKTFSKIIITTIKTYFFQIYTTS